MLPPRWHRVIITVKCGARISADQSGCGIFTLLSLESVVMTPIVLLLLLYIARATAAAVLLMLPAACDCLLVP